MQYTLLDLIKKLEELIKKYPKNENEPINFAFGYAYPIGFTSYRGYYEELSLEFSGEYDGKYSIKQFLKVCKDTIGKEFIGWKGGGFIMNENTKIWIACSGRLSNTIIIDVVKSKYYGFEIITKEIINE